MAIITSLTLCNSSPGMVYHNIKSTIQIRSFYAGLILPLSRRIEYVCVYCVCECVNTYRGSKYNCKTPEKCTLNMKELLTLGVSVLAGGYCSMCVLAVVSCTVTLCMKERRSLMTFLG